VTDEPVLGTSIYLDGGHLDGANSMDVTIISTIIALVFISQSYLAWFHPDKLWSFLKGFGKFDAGSKMAYENRESWLVKFLLFLVVRRSM
jgi:hypothetical protein